MYSSLWHSRSLQPLERDHIAIFKVLNLYWRSPESGGVWYKSGQLKETICSPAEGWWSENANSSKSESRTSPNSGKLLVTRSLSPWVLVTPFLSLRVFMTRFLSLRVLITRFLSLWVLITRFPSLWVLITRSLSLGIDNPFSLSLGIYEPPPSLWV